MPRKKFSEAQIAMMLREIERGTKATRHRRRYDPHRDKELIDGYVHLFSGPRKETIPNRDQIVTRLLPSTSFVWYEIRCASHHPRAVYQGENH